MSILEHYLELLELLELSLTKRVRYVDRIYRAGSKKLYEIEFPEMPGVVFTVEEDVRRALIEGQVLAEWMAAVAAEVWGRRSDEDRRRVMECVAVLQRNSKPSSKSEGKHLSGGNDGTATEI